MALRQAQRWTFPMGDDGAGQRGALELADGRRFEKKRKWHQYNGAEVEHRVQPFRGERLTVVLFSEPEK